MTREKEESGHSRKMKIEQRKVSTERKRKIHQKKFTIK